MDRESLMTAGCCAIDDFPCACCHKLRQLGLASTLCDSEVLTIKTAGDFLRV